MIPLLSTLLGCVADLGPIERLGILALDREGRVLAAGRTDNDGEVAINRHFADGGLDDSFGEAGSVVQSTEVVDDAALEDLAVTTDGGVLVLVSNGAVGGLFAMRIDDRGVVDPTFGTSRFVQVVDVPEVVRSNGVLALDDGTYVVAYRQGIPATFGRLTRLNPDGSPIRSFGTDGVVMLPDTGTIRWLHVDDLERVWTLGPKEGTLVLSRIWL